MNLSKLIFRSEQRFIDIKNLLSWSYSNKITERDYIELLKELKNQELSWTKKLKEEKEIENVEINSLINV